jgi:hypothetical protein
MYHIITAQEGDNVVQLALKTVIEGKEGVLPGPSGNYIFVTPDSYKKEGDGGSKKNTLVVVGHGSSTSLSGCKNWTEYKKRFDKHNIDWDNKDHVYLLACNTAVEENANYVFYKNFADTVKSGFPNATVWACSSTVSGKTLNGDWEKLS